mgnify:CR=1 FL=1
MVEFKRIIFLDADIAVQNPLVSHFLESNSFELVVYFVIIIIPEGALCFGSCSHMLQDDLFECGRFCGVYLHPFNFNGGLLVITPDLDE